MSSPATPSATVRLREADRIVEFTLSRLCKMERATGRTVADLYETIMKAVPMARDANGLPILDAEGNPVPPSTADKDCAARQLSTGFMVDLVGAATDLDAAGVEAEVGLAIIPAYLAVARGLVESMNMLNGRGEDRQPRPTSSPTLAFSSRGEGSSSASTQASSGGLPSPTSEPLSTPGEPASAASTA